MTAPKLASATMIRIARLEKAVIELIKRAESIGPIENRQVLRDIRAELEAMKTEQP